MNKLATSFAAITFTCAMCFGFPGHALADLPIEVLSIGIHNVDEADIHGDINVTQVGNLNAVDLSLYDVLWFDEHTASGQFSGREGDIRAAIQAGTLGLLGECDSGNDNNIAVILDSTFVCGGVPNGPLALTAAGTGHPTLTGAGIDGGGSVTLASIFSPVDDIQQIPAGASILMVDVDVDAATIAGSLGAGRYYITGMEPMEFSNGDEEQWIHNAIHYVAPAMNVVTKSLTSGPDEHDTNSTIEFNETVSNEVGFNGVSNDFFISSDGLYRIEFFGQRLGNQDGGHDHIQSGLACGDGTGERNHDNFNNGDLNSANVQGLRITRVDGGTFDLVSMDLDGEVAVGQLDDADATDLGAWTLKSASNSTVDLSAFTGLTEIYLADPSIAGGSNSPNCWDNIVLLGGDGAIDLVVEVGKQTSTAFDFTIKYTAGSEEGALIEDAVPAEWIVFKINDQDVDGGAGIPGIDQCGESDSVDVNANSGDDVDVFKNGKSTKKCKGATHIVWEPDSNEPMESLKVDVMTRESPGKGHKAPKSPLFAPTSCGTLNLNDGAIAFELNASGELVLIENEPVILGQSEGLCLAAVADLNGGGLKFDGTGDEDGDGFEDHAEACKFFTNPCVFDTDVDSDAVPDAADNCLLVANTDQVDGDGDGVGAACDADDGNAGVGLAQCADGIDNADGEDTDKDAVGVVGATPDAGCTSPTDNDETNPV